MLTSTALEERRSSSAVVWTVALLAAFLASLGVIGADALWLVPLGDHVAHGDLPGSVSFATAASHGWRDVPAGAELLFWALYRVLGGDRGLVLAQVVAAGVGFGALARGLQREASAGPVLLVSFAVLIGSLPAVVVTSISLFSLLCFPLLLVLLESETREPSGRIWLAVPLLAVWGNLHGGVLAGWALLACYLVFERARRERGLALQVLGSATLALFLNPQLWHTVGYYRGIFDSEPARRGSDQWAPLSLDAFGILVAVVAVGLLLAGALRMRFRLWEAIAVAGLILETLHVARTGTWLLFVAAFPAVRALPASSPKPRLLALIACVLAAGMLAALVRGPADPGSEPLAKLAAKSGVPVLAQAILGQQVAIAGGHVLIDNPIDAFSRADQRLYIDWLNARPSGAAAVDRAGFVLVKPKTAAASVAARDARLIRIASRSGGILYRVKKQG